jgi:superfamily II DNA/RNA helicase
MRCKTGCKVDSQAFSSYSSCNSCSLIGWSFDGIVYPWPKLNKNGITYANDNRYLMYIKKRKPRFRLDSIASDLGIIGSNDQKLSNLNNDANKFGLVFKPLRSDIQDLQKDEPILLMCFGDEIEIDEEIVPASDIYSTINSEEDKSKKQMLEDIEKLKQNFIIKDEKRGIKNSLGLKPEQEKAVKSIISTTCNFTIISLPTGYGKTRIIQTALWALRRQGRGPGLMISPLISLMDDQRNQFSIFSKDIEKSDLSLNEGNRGFSNVFLTTAEDKKMSQILKELGNDSIDIIGSSPETLLSSITGQKNLIDKLSQLDNPVSTLILDEAHIIGDWGASFRPDFQLIPWIRDRLMVVNPDLRIVLMSATISNHEEKELKKLLFRTGMKKERISVTKTRRDLSFQLLRYDEDNFSFKEKIAELASLRQEMPKEWNDNQVGGKFRPPALVYTPYKKILQSQLKPIAKEYFHEVRDYTGDTNSNTRENIRIKFINNDIDCLLATSAFGMGIDKPDLWITYYIGMPWTLKGLYQAFGRTARRSNWPHDSSKIENPEDWHNGYCLALIPKSPPRKYRASVGIAKSLERLWDMFAQNCIILPNGYIMIEIFKDIDRTFWKLPELAIFLDPLLENIDEPENEVEDENEDTGDDYIENLNISTNFTEEDFLLRLAKAKRKKRLYKDRLWVLSCLQRTGDMQFLGVHNHILYGNHSEKTMLQSVLETDGYAGVISKLKNIPPYQFESPSGTIMKKICSCPFYQVYWRLARFGQIIRNRT